MTFSQRGTDRGSVLYLADFIGMEIGENTVIAMMPCFVHRLLTEEVYHGRYRMFPLSDSGYAGTLQDAMHLCFTVLIVLFSIALLTLIIIAGVRER